MDEVNLVDSETECVQELITTKDDSASSESSFQIRPATKKDESNTENRKLDSFETILRSLYEINDTSSNDLECSKSKILENNDREFNKNAKEKPGNSLNMPYDTFDAGATANNEQFYKKPKQGFSRNITCAYKSEFPQQVLGKKFKDDTVASSTEVSRLVGENTKLKSCETVNRQPSKANSVASKNSEYAFLENKSAECKQSSDKICLKMKDISVEVSVSFINENDSHVSFEQNQNFPRNKADQCGKEMLDKCELNTETGTTIKSDLCDYVSPNTEKISYLKDTTRAIKRNLIQCSACNLKYLCERELIMHYIAQHTKEWYVCCICNEKFKYEKLLTGHKKTIHRIATLDNCNKCQQNRALYKLYKKKALSLDK